LKNGHARPGAPLLGALFIALMLFGAAATPLNAQTFNASIFDIDPFGGYQFYHGGRIQNMQDGVLGGIRATWDFHKYFGLEFGLTYGKDDVVLFPQVNFPNSTVKFDANSWQLAVNPVLHFTPRGSRIRPFVTAGPAAMWFRPHSGGINISQNGSTYTYPLQAKEEPALIYGGGVKIRLTDIFGIRFDVRGLWTKASHFNLPSAPQGPLGLYSPKNYTDDALQVTGGLMIHFGHKTPVVITVTTSPVGLMVAVDNAKSPSPRSFTDWRKGSKHTICVDTPQSLGGTSYDFANWSDGGAMCHDITVPDTSTTYTATFNPHPVESCNIQVAPISGAADVCACDPGQVSLTSSVTFSPTCPADRSYRWTVNGQSVGGNSAAVTIPTRNLSGAQNVELTASAGGSHESARASFNVRGGGPPTVSLTLSAPRIMWGQTLTLSANAAPPDNCGHVQVTYSASEGSVSGNVFNSSSVAFDPNATQAQEKTITITATATGDCGGRTASATAQLIVSKTPVAVRLSDLLFSKGNARVNNCYKRILLEDLTPRLKASPNSTAYLVGHRDSEEKGPAAAKLDRMRVLNAAAILSAGTGICPSLELSRIKVKFAGSDQSAETKETFCPGSTQERKGAAIPPTDERAKYRRVEVWFVPEGAELPAELRDAMAAPDKDVKMLHCPK